MTNNQKQTVSNDKPEKTVKVHTDNVISNDLLDAKIKSKAKVRITAYQARILADGIDKILDLIDEAIIKDANQNKTELVYELPTEFSKNPYYTQIKNSYINRGFTVSARQSTASRMSIIIKWAEMV